MVLIMIVMDWSMKNLVRPCNTACEGGYETCVDGDWGSCTAKQPEEEICDGFDNDCDGAVDEGLDCLCTIQDIGTLFPCEEDPLLCGTVDIKLVNVKHKIAQ
jgi:hypothetical protein